MIKVGDILRDNNPRSKGRLLYVREIIMGPPDHTHYVRASLEPASTRLTRIRTDRIHEDDKPRRTGYSVVKPT